MFGSGAGLILGLGLFAIAGGANSGTLVQVVVQFVAFFVAGMVAGRFSLVGAMWAGGFAALFLYFGLAFISVLDGSGPNLVALVFFGLVALLLGSAGAVLIAVIRAPRTDHEH